MKQKGFYLLGVKQEIADDKYVKHYIVHVYDPETTDSGKTFVRDPLIRSVFLKPNVLEVLPSGTPITFELDSKMRSANDGKKYEAIVPVEIKPVK